MIPIFHCGKVVEPLATGRKPELIPIIGGFAVVFCIWLQGVTNVDCVAVWFLAINWKVTVSPATAVIFDGLNVRVPFPPTMIRWSSAETREAATSAIATMKRIISIVGRINLGREKEWSCQEWNMSRKREIRDLLANSDDDGGRTEGDG